MKGMRIFMENKFHFTPPFLDSFKETVDIMSEKLNELNTIKGSDVYGICNCSYRMRYLTPKDVSTYIDYIHKGMQNKLIGSNTYDVETFAVEAVKRFMFEHGCPAFDDASIMGNNYAGEEHPTLQDLLLVHSNEVYNRVACTPYEMKERYNNMKSDIKVFNDMHFPANIKKIVDQLPSLISKMDGGAIYENEPLIGKVFRAMVEEFIIFATTINMITVSSMVDYCKPISVFKSNEEVNGVELDEGDSINEQVDTTKNSPVYFVFTSGKTPFISNAIKKATKSPFSHISIAFDSKLNPMYSFGGKIDDGTYVTEKGGVRKEDINDTYYDDLDVVVYGVYIPNDKIAKMKAVCDDYVANADKTTFDYGILMKKLVMKDGSLPKNEYRQVCSTFINHLFKSSDINVTDKNIPSPAELKDVYDGNKSQFHQLYSGKAHDVKPDKLEKKMESFANTRKSKVINEYVTECAMLKTNEITNAHQLPFNCNIRNIVLMDSSEDFDNTLAAIRFILNDSRSPINTLLVKFATVKAGEHVSIDMIKQGFITHHRCPVHAACNDEIKPGFLRHEGQWLDKIVYGSKFDDSNYRSDTPGNMHFHSIEYDITTIYRMFSCHHNDNEHLANNIVKIANIMRGLIDSYRFDKFALRDTMCDILSVFGEILTKDLMLLYHNNNQIVVYRDDMMDTMIPGYMYCESFVMEADDNTNQKADPNSNKAPTVVNKGNLNQATKMQNMAQRIKQLLQKFAEYIRQVLQQIAPKFFTAHKAEREWIKKHKALNEEISKSIQDTSFQLQINDYPWFNVPLNEADKAIQNNADELKKHLNSVEELNKYIQEKGDVNSIAKGLLYQAVAEKITDINDGKSIADLTRNYICYGSTDGIKDKEKNPMLTDKMWNEDIVKLLSDEGIFTAVEKMSKQTNDSLKGITESLQRLVNIEKKNTPSPDGSANDNQQPANTDSNIQGLFNAITNVSKNCWLASVQYMMKDVYGKTYNLYRTIIMEYERQKQVGTQPNTNNNTTNNTNNNTSNNTDNNTSNNTSNNTNNAQNTTSPQATQQATPQVRMDSI